MKRSDKIDWILMRNISDSVLQNVKGCIVEIGIGDSSLVLSELAEKHNRIFYTCDIKGRKCTWLKSFNYKNTKIFNGKSMDFFNILKESPAIVFIDGEHLSETVRKEVLYFLPRISKYGIIFLHDTYPPYDKFAKRGGRGGGDVYKVRQELEKRTDIQTFTFPYTAKNFGLTMVMRKEKDKPNCRR